MTYEHTQTFTAWPFLEEKDIQLIKEIYRENWKNKSLDRMISNPSIGYVYAFRVLELVNRNNCREIIEDYHLWDELVNEITSYMIKFDETSSEYVKAESLWRDLQHIKDMNKA